jgi:hypothetical protein
MTTNTEGYTLPGFVASATLAAAQFKIVKLASTAGQVKLAAAATDPIVGVLNNNPGAAEAAEIQYTGVAKVLAETSVGIGDLVAASSTGRAKTTTTGNDKVLGRALDASGQAGDLIRVLLSLSNY